MKIVIQRVTKSSVEVDGDVVGVIDKGLMVLLGVTHEDEMEDAVWLSKKMCNMRLFRDENDKMNLSVKDIDGEVLVVIEHHQCSHSNSVTRVI